MSAATMEQKGVAQLLQIEEVQLNPSRMGGFSQSPVHLHHMHKKLAFF